MIYPPFRFGAIEEDLYRGAYPKTRNFSFFTRLGLKSIISLTPSPPNANVLEFCKTQSITSIHFRVDKPKDTIPLSFARVAQILQLLLDSANHPIYLHCNDGTIVTGVVVMCLRKLQLWSITASLSEYVRYLQEEVVGNEETSFAERFQAELELPARLPKWLWGGQVLPKKHPTLKLKQLQPNRTQQSTTSTTPSTNSLVTSTQTYTGRTGEREIAPMANGKFPLDSSRSLENALSRTNTAIVVPNLETSDVSQSVIGEITRDLIPPASALPASVIQTSLPLRRDKDDAVARRRAATTGLPGSGSAERDGDLRIRLPEEAETSDSGRFDALPEEQNRAVQNRRVQQVPDDEDEDENMSITLQALALELPSIKK